MRKGTETIVADVARANFALVTGASSGIGRDIARLLAADGHSLVLAARGTEAMETLAAELRTKGVTVHVITIDLADPDGPQRLVDELTSRGITIDILINNAGFGGHGRFDQMDLKHQLDMLQVNIVALTHLTHLLLKPMVVAGRGRVMNVASVAGFLPGPLIAVYYASKAYVLSFSEALTSELEGTGVTVTALCPGPTLTDFHKRAKVEHTALFSANLMASDAVARMGYDGMMMGKRLVIPGWKNRLLTVLIRFVPRGIVLRGAKRVNASRPSTAH